MVIFLMYSCFYNIYYFKFLIYYVLLFIHLSQHKIIHKSPTVYANFRDIKIILITKASSHCQLIMPTFVSSGLFSQYKQPPVAKYLYIPSCCLDSAFDQNSPPTSIHAFLQWLTIHIIYHLFSCLLTLSYMLHLLQKHFFYLCQSHPLIFSDPIVCQSPFFKPF